MGLGEWLGLAGVLLAVIALPVTYWVGRRNKQQPDIRFAMEFDRLSTPGSGLELHFHGQSHDQISRTNIAFWNHRGDTVWGRDMLASDLVRVRVAEDDNVLQVRVVARSRVQNALSACIVDGDGIVEFEFLDAGDGGVIEVLHIGRQSATISGTIPGTTWRNVGGASLGPEDRAEVRNSRWQRIQKVRREYGWLFWTSVLAGVAYAGCLVFAAVQVAALFSRKPRLADASGYDLKTVQGQSDFASQVREVGSTNGVLLWLLVGLATTALISLWFLPRVWYRRTRAAIPRSIVQDDLDPYAGTSDDSTENRVTT